MKRIGGVVIAAVAVLFLLLVGALRAKSTRPEPAAPLYRQHQIGQLSIYSPSTLYLQKRATIYLNLQVGEIDAEDCTAQVDIESGSSGLQLDSGASPTAHLSLVLDQTNSFRDAFIVLAAGSFPGTTNVVLEVSYFLTCGNDVAAVDYGIMDFGVGITASPSTRFVNAIVEYGSDPNLFTGLSGLIISIVALLVTTSLEAERRRADWQSRLDNVDQEIQKDIVHAMKLLPELQKSEKGLDKDQRECIERLRERCESREGFIAYLRRIARAVEGKNEEEIDDILETAQNFYRAGSGLREKIHAVISSRKNEAGTKDFETILTLWDSFDVDSATLVIYSLNQCPKALQAEVTGYIERTPHRRRLMRYKQLTWLDGVVKYEWPPVTPGAPVPDPLVQEWFDRFKIFEHNPFDVFFHLKAGPGRTILPPQEWKRISSPVSDRIVARSENDLLIVSRTLQRELQEGTLFPVYVDLCAVDPAPLWTVVAHQAAETWLEFLSYSPDACLDMYPEERQALAAALAWHCGAISTAAVRLRHRIVLAEADRALNLAESKRAPQELEQKQNESRLSVKLIEASQVPPSGNSSPSPEQLLDWLQIRPFGIKGTCVILVSRQPLPAGTLQALCGDSQPLSARGITIKILETCSTLPPSAVQPDAHGTLGRVYGLLLLHPGARDISWSEEDLMEMLKRGISLATSKRRESFTSLFGRFDFSDPHEADRKLVQKARGSLSRMLELGYDILVQHARDHPDAPDLLPGDLRAIESS